MVINLNPQNFEEEVFSGNTPVIVDFWAPWCGPCQMMGPVFEKLSQEFDGKVKFTKLNVDEHGSFGAQFGVQGIPSLVVFNGKEEIGRIVGFNAEDMLRDKLNEIIN